MYAYKYLHSSSIATRRLLLDSIFDILKLLPNQGSRFSRRTNSMSACDGKPGGSQIVLFESLHLFDGFHLWRILARFRCGRSNRDTTDLRGT